MIDLHALKVGDKVLVRNCAKLVEAATDNEGLLTVSWCGPSFDKNTFKITFYPCEFSFFYSWDGTCPGCPWLDVMSFRSEPETDCERPDSVEIIPQSVKMTTEEGVALVHKVISEFLEQDCERLGTVTGRYAPIAKNMAEEVVFGHDLYTSPGTQLLLIDLKKTARMIHTDYIESKRTWTFRDKSTVVQCLISNEFNTHATYEHSSVIYCGTTTPIPGN